MIDRNTSVTEDELHVYVDGELPADRREAVEAWLSSHPEDAPGLQPGACRRKLSAPVTAQWLASLYPTG